MLPSPGPARCLPPSRLQNTRCPLSFFFLPWLPGQELIETHNTQIEHEAVNSQVDSTPKIFKTRFKLDGGMTGN